MAQEYFDQLHEAVKQAESRGQRFDEKGKLLTSLKGAEGEMQVLPKTARKPGFGVEPAKSRDPDEIARVGRDYLKAMVDKYGDTEKALIAYNWGPKNADDWLASGADKSKLPKETQGYITRVFSKLNATPPSSKPAPVTEPTAAEKVMVPALQSGMTAKADIKSLAQEAGPGYKAAMAMMFLADDKPDDDKTDVWKEAQPEAPDVMAPSALADLSLEYKSPFPEKKPVRMAEGGEAKKMLDDLPNFEDTSGMPFEMIKGGNKMNVEDKQIEDMMLGLGTNSSMLGLNLSKMKQGEKENLAQSLMAAYRTKIGDTDVSVMGMRPTGAPPGTYMGGVSAAVPVYGNDRMILGATGMQTPDRSGVTGYNLGYSGNVGPGRLDAMMMQPVNSSQGRSYQVQYRLPVGRAEGSPMGGEMSQRVPMEGENTLAGSNFPATRSQDQLRAYVEALNPRANIVVGDLGGTTRGFVTARKPDTINLSSTLTPGTREITTLHELEHSMDVKGGDILGRPEIGTMDNNYRAYHLLGKNWAPIRDTVKNMVDNKEKIEKFFGRPIDDAYFRKGSYSNLKKSNDTEALFSEQLATLSALEQATGKFLTQDPEMRQLFPNYQMMAVYDALTGPRQTRMDARDLPPHLPTPSYTYAKNPIERFLIKSMTGENEYGTPRQPIPIKRAEGSPMGGENADHLTPQEIERMAAAQGPAFGVFPQMQPYRSKQDREASANVPVDVTRGRLAGTFGLFGDVANQPIPMVRPFQLLSQAMTGQQKYPDTEYFLENLPLKSDTPVGTATGKAASFVPLNPAPVVNAITRTAEKVGGKAAEMMGAFKKTKEAPAPEFQNAVETEMVRLNQSRQYPRDYTQPADPFMGVAPTVEEARANVIARQTPEASPSAVPEVAPVAPPVQPGVPAEFPIVGRLDAYVSELKSPVQKQQFINQVKNKFRDYDVDRVQEALVDFGDKDKLQPEQIKAALDKLYSPSGLRVEERALGSGGLWDTADNVYQQPMGSVNLYINQPAEIAARAKQVNELETGLNSLYNGTLAPEKIADLKNVVDNHELVSTLPSAKAVSDALTHVEKSYTSIANAKKELRDISNGYMYPVLYSENGKAPFWDLARAHEMEVLKAKGVPMNPTNPAYDFTVARGKLPDMERNELERQGRIAATKEVIRRANERAVKLGTAPVDTRYLDFSMVDKPYDIIRESPALKHEVQSTLEPIELQVNEGLKRIKRYLEKNSQFGEELAPHRLYEGQHPTVTPGGYPVGFSRFTEHEVTVPGYGTLQGRHIHDFQSDLAQDVRSKGPKGGNLEKDKLEYEKLSQEQNAAMREPPENMPDADKKKLALEMAKRDKRISELGHRIRSPKTNYSLEQPFAGFETRPAVEQQLMMKTSIQAAMRAGKNFVTFPGGESMQPALYEKIPNNLRQVVKDMGAEGMQIQLINLPPTTREIKNAKGEITHPLGKPITAVGLVWSPEAAQRIIQGGVPFAKGGSVEKSNTDYRAYI